MRMLTLAGASLPVLLASIAAARAAPLTFSYTGATVTYTVPTTGTYDIVAYGAQGGGPNGTGGLGAEIGGDVTLTQGEMIEVAVGGMGGIDGTDGDGGGGSFVVTSGGVPLMIAGGGGGDGFYERGGDGQTAMGSGTGGSAGGTGDNTGSGGGGGGGFTTAGGNAVDGGRGGSGYPSLKGGVGGYGNGGFGGGGAGGVYSGGGGGGYSGGSGGTYGPMTATLIGSTGGDSFDAGLNNADLILVAGENSGNGLVTIDLVTTTPTAVPEPASLLLLGVGAAGVLGLRHRRKRRLAG